MVDMAATIIPRSDQINADDLLSGPRTITITKVTGNDGNAEQPVNFYFEGDNGKPYRPCKSMRRVVVKVWGPDASKYVGRSMTLFRDPKVKWGGMEVGGIRISHMTGLEKAEVIALTETRSARKPFTVHPLKIEAKPDVPAPKEDRAVLMANALIDRARTEDLDAFEADPKVIEQRAWLAKKRPDLSAQVDAAILDAATLEGAE